MQKDRFFLNSRIRVFFSDSFHIFAILSNLSLHKVKKETLLKLIWKCGKKTYLNERKWDIWEVKQHIVQYIWRLLILIYSK